MTLTASKSWITDDGRFRFGKHGDERVGDVVRDDPSYVRWIIETVEHIRDDERQMLVVLMKRGYGDRSV